MTEVLQCDSLKNITLHCSKSIDYKSHGYEQRFWSWRHFLFWSCACNRYLCKCSKQQALFLADNTVQFLQRTSNLWNISNHFTARVNSGKASSFWLLRLANLCLSSPCAEKKTRIHAFLGILVVFGCSLQAQQQKHLLTQSCSGIGELSLVEFITSFVQVFSRALSIGGN